MTSENKETQFYPTCKFCGQPTLPLANYKSQEDADESATLNCDCYDARQYQYEKEKQEERKKNITKLKQSINDFAEYCDKRGAELTDQIHNLILSTGVMVLDGIITSASFKFAKIKANISQNSKGNIVIGFTYSDGARVEV